MLLSVPAVALNDPLVAPAPTVIDAGTVRAPLLLDKEIAAPPVGAPAERVTVQLEDWPLVRVAGVHANDVMTMGAVRVSVVDLLVPLYTAETVAD